jgi:hypothetical protein
MKPPAAQDYPPEDWIQVKTGSGQIGFHRRGFLEVDDEDVGARAARFDLRRLGPGGELFQIADR